jgi:hypothetical protein
MLKQYISGLLTMGLILCPAMVHAGSLFPTLPKMIETEWQSHSIMQSTRLRHSAAGGLSLDHYDRHRVLREILQIRGVHPLMQLVERPSDYEGARRGISLTGAAHLNVRHYLLRVGKYDVCDANFRTVESPSGTLNAMGVIPNVSAVYPFVDDAWPGKDEAVSSALSNLMAAGVDPRSYILTQASMCLYPEHEQLTPAWKIVLRIGHVPYQFYVGDAGVLEGDILGFDIDAKVRAYRKNPKDGQISDFTVNVTGDGFLTNEYFTTTSSDPARPRQQASNNIFAQSMSSGYAPEQSAFAHVNEHFDFASSKGYLWKGPKPLTVKTNVTFSGGDVNNALYTPFDGRFGPFILIANGDGIGFQGLALDSDVVSHEFGHHIIFGSITSTQGESLVIHEGLADAIAFMRSGDGCLGESICPVKANPSDSRCQINGSCLRSGATSMKYGDSTYNSSQAHFKGQIVSGLFWDLYQSGKIPKDEMGKLAIGTVAYLPARANIAALVTAILDADFALFNRQYQSAIIDAAAGRGMGVDKLGINLASIDGIAPPSEEESKSKSGGGGFLGLCSIGSGHMSMESSLLIAIILILPIAAQIIVTRRRPVLVPIPKKTGKVP